tara:strand:- start:990 stop:2132 length:1143 start_codon:yes stop_codon:yes gene_type:complete
MSRILKRPMFRKGGSTSKGIMTGLVDRKQYATGIPKEELAKNVGVLEEVLRDYTPKTRVPYGAFGLDIATGTPILEAFKKRYGQFTTADDKREAAIKGGAAKLGIGKALEKGKVPTLKQVRNTSNQVLFGIEPGKTGFASAAQIMSAPGALTPIDKSQKISVSPTGEVTITEGGGQGKTEQRARDLNIQTFKMNNAASNLFSNLKGAKTGTVGSFITALDSTGAQLKMAADSFGFSTTGKNKTFDDTGSGDIDKYIQKKFGTFIGDDAAKFGRIKSASINLAYLMARIDEPGGRFTDRDIALKMEELGIGANPERTMNIMANAIKLRNENANYEYGLLTGGKSLDFSKMNVIGSTPKKKKKTFFRPGPDGVYREYETEKD